MAKNVLTAEQKKAIDNYGNSIKTLQTFVEMVRTRPGMYIGPIGNGGYLNMFREILQNSIDQLVSPESPCDWIRVYVDDRDHRIIIEDNGMGIPFSDMERIFTKQHTSKNFTKVLYQYASGLNGVGAKVVNALSALFNVESYHYSGNAKRMELRDGKIIKAPFDIKSESGKQGTKIEFIPQEEVLGTITLTWKSLYHLTRLISSLTQLNSIIYFEAVDIDGNVFSEKIVNEDGILANLIMKTTSPIIKPIHIFYDTGVMRAEVAMTWASATEKLLDSQGFNAPYSITTFSNWCPTRNEGSTHFEGFMDGVASWFTNYMNKFYLSEKSKVKITRNDCFEQLCAMVSVAHLEPEFIGQSKDILSNNDMKPFVRDSVKAGLDEWAKSNPQDLQRVCKWIKDVATARMRSEDYKVNIKVKDASKLTGLPFKYEPPTGNEDLELVIVEGDSAGGHAKSARDPKRQGIFPIRGKILNPFGNSMKKCLQNEEIKGLIAIIANGKYGKNFDARKCKFKKIIFMADADVDGAHIATLLLRVFLVFFPGLIESGIVYKAVPPLYAIKKGNNAQYFVDNNDFNDYKQNLFIRKNEVMSLDGKKLTGAQVKSIFNDNDEYLYELNRVADNYSLDPNILELVLNCYIKKPVFNNKELIKELNKAYRFNKTVYNKDTDTLYIEVYTNNNAYCLYFNTILITDCVKVIPYLQNTSNTHLILNGNVVSLYNFIKAFESIGDIKGMSHFKGLGEMDEEDLADCLRPDGNRTICRYTTSDVNADIEAIREYESDKSKILKFLGVVKRSDLIGA